MSDPRAVVMEWLEGLWIRRDPSVIDRLRAEGARSTGLERGETIGREGFHEFYARCTRVFESIRFEYKTVLVQGDDIALHLDFFLKRNGKVARLEGALFAAVMDGKIVKAHNVWNLGEACRAFGLPPALGFEDLLVGLEAQAS